MFNSISGIITAKLPKQIFIENNGIEWDICVPDSNLDMLPSVGSEAKVYTWLQHTEQAMNLFGFASNTERSLFLDLLKVDGVGPKGAVKIMSSASSSQLLQILENGDVGLLEKIPGVGKKTAGKMLLALKGKLSIQEESVVKVTNNVPFADVITSLVNMGYDKKSVEIKIAQIVEELNSDSSFNTKSQKDKEDILFRKAIMELA
ncbi:MAG: Holliday junction branch migration protein RuvA [Treponema sp.]|nr:Holliday junction branch migration protein RuvA [Treponema sp.]